MTDEKRAIPADPLGFIGNCVRSGNILWTHHVNMRMSRRKIDRSMVIGSVETYEIIEAYPEDKYHPSFLVYAEHEGVPFHILFGVDVLGENVRIVTTYHPDPDEWTSDLKRRKPL